MSGASLYRRRAEDCLLRASQSGDDFHRKNFSELAAMWTEMADKAEGRETSARKAEEAKKIAEKKLLDDALATIRNA